jgi:hypothetical protein
MTRVSLSGQEWGMTIDRIKTALGISDTEISALISLATLPQGTTGEVVVKTGPTSFANIIPPSSGSITAEEIRAILGVTALSGSNTGDQDFSEKVDKVEGYSLIADTEIAKIHAPGSDTPDISGKVDKVIGSSLVADSAIANIHASGSDNQDLSGLQPKESGKGLSTNDYSTADQSKLAGIASCATVGADWNTNVTNKPTIPDAQVQTDWNASSGMGQLLNKPTISGSNTGDNSANSLYSGLEASKADVGQTFYIGTTQVAINRESDALTLAGLTLTTPVIGAATGTSLAVTGAITSSGTAGIGYVAGAGGTVTQGSSRTTGVTLSKLCGTITMFSSAVAAAASSTFTWTNTLLAATDIVIMEHNGSSNRCSWKCEVICGAGSATVVVKNISAASITEATPLKFIVIKAANS